MLRTNKDIPFTFTTIVFILSLLLLIFNITIDVSSNFIQQNVTLTITEKEVVNGTYLFYGRTQNREVLVVENKDNMLYGKFNSSDIYSTILIGKTYNLKVIGYRIPFLSRYQNIISYELIE